MARRSFHYIDEIVLNDSPTDVESDARVLFDAVRHGKTHLVRFILEAAQGDIVNCRDLHGKTPLMACCYTKEEGARDKLIKLLLRHGADVNATDDFGRTVLSYVCEKRCNDLLRILVKEHNIDPDVQDLNGNAPLSYSAMVGNDIACDSLLRHFRRLGLNVDVTNIDGFTPLLLAAKNGNITCAQILLGQGKAALSARDRKYGLSVDEWLAKRGFSVKDISPVRHDGRGRSRFIKVANVASLCSGPRKVAPVDSYMLKGYAQEGLRLERLDVIEDGYNSDATTDTTVSTHEERHYMARRYSDSLQVRRNSKPRFQPSPPLARRPSRQRKSIGVQTMPVLIDSETAPDMDDATVVSTAFTELKDNFQLDRAKPKRTESKRNILLNKTASSKRFSLPEVSSVDNDDTRKNSLDSRILPDKLIATIDLGDGRRQSIQIHPDSFKNKVYWTPYPDHDGSETAYTLLFEPQQKSDNESQCSTNDEQVAP